MWANILLGINSITFLSSGQSLGAVVGIPLTGFIASSGMGWPGIFRFYGLVCAIVGGLMWRFLADTPADHPSISAIERMYIEAEMGQRKVN